MDDHVVRPEISRDELVRGRRVLANPALPPHGDAHCDLDYMVRAHVRPDYVASTDLLTRIAPGSDFATDTSVRREGEDGATGDRHLEEMAFEVANTQTMRDLVERAEELTARGVRRVFAIFVRRGEVSEWSPDQAAFVPLPIDGAIEDACLVRPLPVRALIDRAESDNAVARALLAKRNPVIDEVRRSGLVEGRREGVERLCEVLGIELTEARRATLARMDEAQLAAASRDIARERRWTAAS